MSSSNPSENIESGHNGLNLLYCDSHVGFEIFKMDIGAYASHNENFVYTWALKEPGVRSQEPEEKFKN